MGALGGPAAAAAAAAAAPLAFRRLPAPPACLLLGPPPSVPAPAPRSPPLRLTPPLAPPRSITNDDGAKAGRVTFRGHAHSHATGPDEHAYQLDLELYGEVDEQDIKQVRCVLGNGQR